MKKITTYSSILLFSIVVAYLLNPWKIICLNYIWLIDFFIVISILISAMHLSFLIKIRSLKVFLIFLAFIIILPNTVILFSPRPQQMIYQELYTNSKNSNETISIIHNHSFIHSKNTIIHQIKYDSFNMILQRKFNESNLNGLWIIHSENPFHDNSGTYNFENGKILHPTQNQ